MSNYEWSLQRLYLIDLIEEADGEITPEIEKLLSTNEEEGIDLVSKLIDLKINTEAEIDMLEEEIKRLNRRIAARNRFVDRMKEYIKQIVEEIGSINPKSKDNNKFLQTPLFKISIATNSKATLTVTDDFYTNKEELLNKLLYNNINIKSFDNEKIMQILKDNNIDLNYVKMYEEKNIDRTTLEQMLDNGEIIKGVTLEKGKHLRFS